MLTVLVLYVDTESEVTDADGFTGICSREAEVTGTERLHCSTHTHTHTHTPVSYTHLTLPTMAVV